MSETGLLVATTNLGKKKEIDTALADLPLRIFSLNDLNIGDPFPETGKTFQENARGKSLFYSQKWNGLTLGEDSGLEIDYLNGAPGVYSARFSEPQATDEKNNDKVLSLLEGLPDEKRSARFVSCMVLSQKGEVITSIEGRVDGYISRERKGSFGFGYDPLFYYPPLDKNFGELLPAEKNDVSHRGRALKELRIFLKDYLTYS